MYALTYKNQLRSTEASLPVRSGCSLRRRSLFGELLRHGSLGPCHGDQGASAAGIQRDEAGRRQAPQLTVNTSGRTPELNAEAPCRRALRTASVRGQVRSHARKSCLARSLAACLAKRSRRFFRIFPNIRKPWKRARPPHHQSPPEWGYTKAADCAIYLPVADRAFPRSVGHLFGLPG